jgi:hypothetical protein
MSHNNRHNCTSYTSYTHIYSYDAYTYPYPILTYAPMHQDGADEDLVQNLGLKLSACPAGGVLDGTCLVIEDFTQSLEVRLYSTILYVNILYIW